MLDDTTYNEILDKVAQGALVTDVCEQYGIPRNQLWRYAEDRGEEARTAYTRARTMQAHSMAEDTIRESKRARGMDSDGVAAQRLVVDTMKWLVTKIAPRLYGDRIDVTSNGERIVSGVIMLPPEDSVQPVTASTVTARLLSDGASLDSTVDATTVDAAERTGEGEGVGGGAGTVPGE